MENPYLNPDADADILIPKAAEVDGNTAEDNFVKGVDVHELPEEVREALGQYTNVDVYDAGRASMPVHLKMVTALMEFYTSISDFKSEGTLVASVAEVLDIMTEGRVELTYRRIEAERKIITSKILLRINEAFLQLVEADLEKQEWSAEVQTYIESYIELVEYGLDSSVREYREMCEHLGRPVDEHLIETGHYSQRNYILRAALSNPPGDSDI